MGNYNWFDEKCEEGKLTYADKSKLFKELFEEAGFKIHGREKEKLENMLKQALFNFKSTGNESAHVSAHNLLTCFAQMIDLTPEKHTEYQKLYDDALKKHLPECKLKINYKKS